MPVRRALAIFTFFAGLALWIVYIRWERANEPVAHVDVYDGFEARKLSGIWDDSRFVRGAVTMQPDVVRAGRSAARVVLHSRDKFEAGAGGDADSERDELMEASQLLSKANNTYEYSFSMLIPADFPIVPTRLVIAQWKQDCHGHANCSNDAPLVAVRYISGVLKITHQIGAHRATPFETAENLRGKWTDFRFQIRFSSQETGRLKAWLNGRQVVDYTGVTAYPENATTGYRNPSLFYFKMGLYRDVMAQPMTIYIDETRQKQLD